METAPEPRAVPRLVGTCHLAERTGAMIQWVEGIDPGPHWPLMPFSKRSLTHGEKNQPAAVGMEPASEPPAVPRLVGTYHLPERVGAMIQWVEGPISRTGSSTG